MLLVVSILTMAGHFQLFAEPYVMTQGGPAQRTVTVLYFMYEPLGHKSGPCTHTL